MTLETKTLPRIVFISTMHGPPWGGSEELWGRAATILAHEKRAQVWANVCWNPQLARPLQNLMDLGVSVERNAPLPSASLSLYRRAARSLAYRMGRRIRIPAYLEQTRPDLVVISQGAHFDGAGWMIECANRQLRYAPIVQCYVEGHPFADTHTDSLVRGYGEASASFFVSNTNLRCVERQIAAPIPSGEVVRNPFNVSYEACPPWPDTSDGLRLACVARLDLIVKGQDILFEVLAQPKWKARPLSVSLYGAGPNESSLRRLKELYKLDNVSFCGTTDDIEGMWRTHHGLVLTSRWEGLPLAVVEAMLCGRVCIVTEACGSADLMENDVSGFVASAAKFDLVDDALERAWAGRGEWQAIGARARTAVRAQVPPSPERVFADRLLTLATQNRV